ncbi:hypothetical protein P4C99_06435 [Pontiellaceae bacterium B1224]|nr:hypothetical protein [Pontiellaceae bacterium B1224]
MRGMKRSIMLFGAILMTLSIEAAPIVLKDAQWSSMVVDPHNSNFHGSITSSTNYPRDPGFRWDVYVENTNSGPYGLLGIGADTVTMGITVNTGDVWTAELINLGTNPTDYNIVTLSAYVTSDEYVGWVIRPGVTDGIVDHGDSNTLSWDFSEGETMEIPQRTISITSVSGLGLLFFGDKNGEEMLIQVGSSEPYNYDVWLEEQYPDLGLDAGKTDNPDGDALDNWNEYAFGGNPTNAADTGYPVEYGAVDGGSFFAYIHALRKGCDDLGYVIEIRDDMVIGAWTNDTVSVASTNENFTADFSAVTNLFPTDVGLRFIRMHAVEQINAVPAEGSSN